MEDLTRSSRNGYHRGEMVTISMPQQASFDQPGIISTQSWKGCFQKVPDLLRREEHNKRDYDPAVVSFGPYHHGKPELKLVENFKPKALELFAAESGKDPDFFYNKVLEAVQIQDLRRCYVENSTDEYDDAVFARMMLLDACFIVYYIRAVLEYQDMMSKARIDHHQVLDAMINQLPMFKAMIDHLGPLVVHVLLNDVFLLENQIPLCLLKLLIDLKCGKDEGEEMISKFLRIFVTLEDKNTGENEEGKQPPHLLAAFRRKLVADCSEDDQTRIWSIFGCQWKRKKINHRHGIKKYVHTFRSVTDLKAKGIHFKPSLTESFKDINFKSSYFFGELRLPICVVSVHTKVFLLNLIAFEMCPNNVTDQTVLSYISFMKSLIESPEDVKELREKQILINMLGSDEEVLQVYKDINTFGVNNYGMFYETREKIQEHYNSKAKTWAAELIHTYFTSPWTVIALFTAVAFLCLTFLETSFTIHPSSNKLLINLKWGKDEGEEMLSKFFSSMTTLESKHAEESKTEEKLIHLIAALRIIIVADCSRDDEAESCYISGCQWKIESLKQSMIDAVLKDIFTRSVQSQI